MSQKRFLTYEEQISLLKTKDLIIDDEEKAIMLLKKYSYFALINGYKMPFKSKNGSYKRNTRFEDIYYLYQYDDNLRHVLMKYLLIVELHIKSLLSYSFCKKYGEKQSEYQNATNYNYQDPTLQKSINDLIQELSNRLSNLNNIAYLKHQDNNHGNVPLWALMKVLTIGNVSKMYGFQQPDIQSEISKEFDGIHEKDLEVMLDILTRYRNVCAHNERLFDFKYKKRNIRTNKFHKFFHLDKSKVKETNLFDVIISLKFLLSEDEFKSMVEEISELINNLFKKTNQIQRSQLLKMMGFPLNWESIKAIKENTLKIT